MLKNVQQELNAFAKYVIKQSRTNLTKGKNNDTKELYNSLKYDLNVSKNSLGLEFLMEEYHTQTFGKCAKRRGVQFRDKKGRYVSHKQTGFMLAQVIKKNGIKPSMFFTKPFKKAFKNLDKDIVSAFRLDVEQLIKSTTNGNN